MSNSLSRAAFVSLRHKMLPGLRNSNWIYHALLQEKANDRIRWLDLGCGHTLLPGWMCDRTEPETGRASRTRFVVGVDADLAALRQNATVRFRLNADIECLPFRSQCFELVTANMVIEHVEHPAQLLREVERVLAPGGYFLFHTPNRLFYQIWIASWLPGSLRQRLATILEGRAPSDVYPTHYRMNSPGAVRRFASRYGLTLEALHMANSGFALARFGVLSFPELLLMRLLQSPRLTWARSNMIAVLQKPAVGASSSRPLKLAEL